MRPHFLTPALLFLATCSDTLPPRLPPLNSLAYPSALVHVPGPGFGTLYVASSNFDKFYDNGAVVAVNLDGLPEPLPPFGGAPALEDRTRTTQLNVQPEEQVLVQSITGQMALWKRSETESYLFVPSRSEGDLLQVVRANGTNLSCPGTDSDNCATRAFSLTEAADRPEGLPEGLPGAPAPFGVSIGERVDPQNPGARIPEVWVTHLTAALPTKGDNRVRSATTYVVKADPSAIVDSLQDAGQTGPFRLSSGNFLELTSGVSQSTLAGGHTVALGQNFAYLTARTVVAGQGIGGTPPFLLRAINRATPSLSASPGLRASYPDVEARGVALNATETRIYVAGRAAGSTLLVGDVAAGATSIGISVVRAINTLPPGASEVRVISRATALEPNRRDLVLITCTDAGVLAIYDDEVGDIVAQVPDLGQQPFALAVEPRTHGAGVQGARVYVANFGDGQVSVIDIDNLDQPQGARVVARLGALQNCASDDPDESCPKDQP